MSSAFVCGGVPEMGFAYQTRQGRPMLTHAQGERRPGINLSIGQRKYGSVMAEIYRDLIPPNESVTNGNYRSSIKTQSSVIGEIAI